MSLAGSRVALPRAASSQRSSLCLRHSASSLRPLLPALCRQQHRAATLLLRASATPPTDKKPEKDNKAGESLLDRRVKSMVSDNYTPDAAQRVLKNLEQLGIKDPKQLQLLFLNRGFSKLVPRAISVLLNGAACYTAFLSFDLSRRAEDLGFLQRFVESVCFTVGLNYGLGFLSELFTFGSIAAAALLFGANVEVFLAAVTEAAGDGASARSGLGAVDSVREAQNAVKVVETLNAIRELLRAQAAAQSSGGAAAMGAVADTGAAGDFSARATFLNLAALLAVANGAASKKFDASEWELTEAEAVRIAKVFVKYDGADSRLDVMQLRRLTEELGQPLSDEESRLAMTYLDEDGNGAIDFAEFVSWWAGTRRFKSAAGK